VGGTSGLTTFSRDRGAILLIAASTFTTRERARASQRSREVALRKSSARAFAADRQFLGESVLDGN